MVRVVVGSQSTIKTGAVRAAFEKAFKEVDVECVAAESGVRDQPVGMDETRRGAANRLANAMGQMDGADYYVAMENGIVEMGECGWYDLAWVVVHCTASNETCGVPTTGLPFPLKYVQQSEAAGYAKTVGSLMRADGWTSSSTDPHASLTQGLLTREDILTQGVAAALGMLREA
eukprot:TRINITY_DN12020_c0_g1_i1.p1 TRINITY_DN12020_c0_g1~~TRINITY_DN12020_c0_g1_i1.p1  ORF type:complete len:174 (+),score=29.46 TRINITY_DN12020_c0_g1_i1:66-587(+)